MELYLRDFRAMTFYDFQQGLTLKQHSNRMKSMLANEAPFKAIMGYNWFKKFSLDHKYLNDNICECWPRNAVASEYIVAVRKQISSIIMWCMMK